MEIVWWRKPTDFRDSFPLFLLLPPFSCFQISAACGAVGTLSLGTVFESLHAKATGGKASIKLEYANNGVLAGLVAITAGCSVNSGPYFTCA